MFLQNQSDEKKYHFIPNKEFLELSKLKYSWSQTAVTKSDDNDKLYKINWAAFDKNGNLPFNSDIGKQTIITMSASSIAQV